MSCSRAGDVGGARVGGANRPGDARVLMAEDDPGLIRFVRVGLARHGLAVEAVRTGGQLLERYQRCQPDAILVSLGLADTGGPELIRELRDHTDAPIIVLPDGGSPEDEVATLAAGADDYLGGPLTIDRLVAHVRAVLRRGTHRRSGDGAVFRSGELEVDLEHRRVRVAGREVHLTRTEYNLLRALIADPGTALTSQMLLHRVWGSGYEAEAGYVRTYVNRLRKKLGDDPCRSRYIIGERGIGYRLLAE